MIIELVYGAVARKMLCEPLSSLIADTEWVCAAGIALRELKASEGVVNHILDCGDIASMQKKMNLYLAEIDSESLDKRLKNLLLMLQEYRGAEHGFTKEYKEIFQYGYQNVLTFPKGLF